MAGKRARAVLVAFTPVPTIAASIRKKFQTIFPVAETDLSPDRPSASRTRNNRSVVEDGRLLASLHSIKDAALRDLIRDLVDSVAVADNLAVLKAQRPAGGSFGSRLVIVKTPDPADSDAETVPARK